MSKQMIVGVRYGNYTDKKTGEVIDYVELQTVKTIAACYGHAVELLYVSSTTPIYNFLLQAAGNKCNNFPELIGYYINVDRSTKGFLVDIELVDKKEDDVIFNF